jgi:hypothetical protein
VPPPIEITPAPLTAPEAVALIAALDAELTARYPDPADNHFTLDTAEYQDSPASVCLGKTLTG